MFEKAKKRKGGISPQARTALEMGERLFRILRLVQQRRPGQPLRREQLAEACECNIRTITRALSVLEIEYDITYNAAERAYVSPREERLLPTAPLSFNEIMALAAAGSLLRSPQFPHHGKAASALDKIVGGLSPIKRAVADAALRQLAPITLPRDYGQVEVQPYLDAMQNGTTLRLDYESYSSGTRRVRAIDPYAVEPREGLYYELHGWCHENRELRTFALDRVYGVEETEQTFVRDEAAWSTFAKAEGIGGMRGDGAPLAVDVRFAPLVVRYARTKHWAATLELCFPEADGAAHLRGHIADGSPRDALLSELMRWRRHVTIVGGPEFREAYLAELRAMLDQHCLEN